MVATKGSSSWVVYLHTCIYVTCFLDYIQHTVNLCTFSSLQILKGTGGESIHTHDKIHDTHIQYSCTSDSIHQVC